VRAPWGQSLTAFEQNVVVGDRSEPGDEVILHWAPEHTFGLDGGENVFAGVDPGVLELETAAEVG
jgi:spermidine/putrescine transport system ATP-binding protein